MALKRFVSAGNDAGEIKIADTRGHISVMVTGNGNGTSVTIAVDIGGELVPMTGSPFTGVAFVQIDSPIDGLSINVGALQPGDTAPVVQAKYLGV